MAGDAARGGVTISRGKDWLLSLALSLASLVFCLAVIEGALRFLPVSTGLRSVAVDAEHPVLHFTPDRPFVNSLGWDFHNVVRGRVNNAGFVNDQDYAHDGLPLIAVVGDSFIEAQMVAYPQTLQGRLAAALKDKFRVYSFAGSGAPLSQYLIWADYAVHAYGAKAVIINVVGNDFDESLAAYRIGPGFWQYSPDQNEYSADRYAVETTLNKKAFLNALRKLAGINLAETSPPAVVEFLFHSHPSIEKRIRSIEALGV